MQIPEKLQSKWRDLRNDGDAEIIAKEAGVTGATIRNAYRLGKCNEEVFTAMSKFYAKRLKLVKKYA